MQPIYQLEVTFIDFMSSLYLFEGGGRGILWAVEMQWEWINSKCFDAPWKIFYCTQIMQFTYPYTSYELVQGVPQVLWVPIAWNHVECYHSRKYYVQFYAIETWDKEKAFNRKFGTLKMSLCEETWGKEKGNECATAM